MPAYVIYNPVTPADLRTAIGHLPSLRLQAHPSPLEPMPRLSAALGGGPRLFVKRDDAITFGFGGNKVRKLSLVAARAKADGADTLITAGGIQSNHARATAATAARLGMRAILVANGAPPDRPTGNALLDRLLGAEIVHVASREERTPKMEELAARVSGDGGHPFVIPVGASTPLGAMAFALAVTELLEQMPAPDVIVHATSSGGTQAGLVAGCRLLGLATRVIGVSADDREAAIAAQVDAIIHGIADALPGARAALTGSTAIEVDDRFVGGGYGVPTPESTAAIELAARTEALFLDPTYTGKAMAGLIERVRAKAFADGQTVLFWHTGGQVGLFA
jgi:1-aminocyclopropane-1-carboxylate deaminase/D-cysteine desulfhydrase-like pyridoxal-dependent ACC family enzyme